VRLGIDAAALGLDPAKMSLYAPLIRGFQPEAQFKVGEDIPVMPGRGWLFLVDEEPRKPAPPVDLEAGMKVLIEERFSGDRLSGDWRFEFSKAPGTRLTLAEGGLVIYAPANAAAFAEYRLPPGAALVSCSLDPRSDQGASWGPGMALAWPDGKTLRVNVRSEGRFGVDDGRRQLLEGFTEPGTQCRLVVELKDKEFIVQASQDGKFWQELARFPRSEFAGDPTSVRLGKMSPGGKNEDFATPGPDGACAIRHLRVMGR
jgi:hypothetical protein